MLMAGSRLVDGFHSQDPTFVGGIPTPCLVD